MSRELFYVPLNSDQSGKLEDYRHLTDLDAFS